jgi:hypothetical protein
MHHFEILLPFGLPAPEIAPDLLRTLRAPALSTLIAKAKAAALQGFDPFARTLPHEVWLAERLRLPEGTGSDSSPPVALSRMRGLQMESNEGYWFLLQPVHIHIARDHLVLTDTRRTNLSEPESRALFDTAQPLFQQAGKDLLYGNADTWLLRADDWRHLQTATPDAACGHNIDIWMPKGEGERAWRKLQNEVQMEWHEHAVNTERAAQHLPPVNSLWLWGGAQAGPNMPDMPYAYTGAPFTAGGTAITSDNLPDLLSTAPSAHLVRLDDLSEAALAQDWGSWLEAMQALEQTWFAPLLRALQAGQTQKISLILGHHAQLRTFTASRLSLRKFWIKPSLTSLLP